MNSENNTLITILIVDDEPSNLQVLLEFLGNRNYRVLIAAGGIEAINIANSVQPDLILLDILMPGMDGFEVCKKLKNTDETREIPIIFMSALSDTDNKIKGFDLGAADYITKPFNQKETLARIETHLSITRLRKNLKEQNTRLEIEIKERIKAQEELQESKALLQAAMDHSPAGIAIADAPDGKLRYVNDSGLEISGKNKKEIVNGIGIDEYVASWQVFHFDGTAYKTDEIPLARAIMYGEICSREFIIRRPNNEDRIVLANAAPVYNAQGKITAGIAVFLDISERKRAEQEKLNLQAQIQKTQKMESIGNLAGGIAHDFNNILFPIMGMSELLLEDFPQGSLEYENAQEIFKAGKRGSDLVKQILAFSHQDKHETMPVRIQHVLKEVLNLSRSVIPSNIEIIRNIQADCGMVMAEPTQIHQVAMNLITNAFHALEQGMGKINVKLEETILEDKDIYSDLADNSLLPGKYAVLSVSDTGCGIDPDKINRIFEPYYTTKKQGKGTGLGLAVTYGIVKKYHGDIKVVSEIGKGSTFNVFFPLMEKNAEHVLPKKIEKILGGSENILLVDDEEPIADLEKQMLKRLGYNVTVRTSSIEAFEVFKIKPDMFDLVISDMTMPNMTGDQLAEKLLLLRPDIPIIICTGYSERINDERIKASGIKGLLMKPLLKSDMAEMIRNVLDEAKDSAQ
ncbi:response regulator [Desulfobacterales bacterium HSG17]|nr:response regulator [Desulfobacterales bacterium HSG17]